MSVLSPQQTEILKHYLKKVSLDRTLATGSMFFLWNSNPKGTPIRHPVFGSFFLAKFAKKMGKPLPEVSTETMSKLTHYPWPGNIRELENVIELTDIHSQGPTLTIDESFEAQTHTKPCNNAVKQVTGDLGAGLHSASAKRNRILCD